MTVPSKTSAAILCSAPVIESLFIRHLNPSPNMRLNQAGFSVVPRAPISQDEAFSL